jgi:amino acid adenylation domain-containing protein
MSTMVELSDSKRLLLQKLLRGEGMHPDRLDSGMAPREAGSNPPISAEQRHVWLHASMAPDVPLYNEAITIHRRGSFDFAALEASINEIVRRHEAWRTSFELVGGGLRQVVHPRLQIRLNFTDLTDLPDAEREDEALQIATADARKPFDLVQLPLLRGHVLKLAQDVHRLYLALHHIIFDGVSIHRVVIPELTALYEAISTGRTPKLPVPAAQYGDYALWRERDLARDAVTRDLEYWRRQLAGELPDLQLPSDRQILSTPTYRGAMETFTLSSPLTASLKALSRNEGVTLYVTLLAAFKTLLHRYSGGEDLLIGGVTDMRRRPELEGVVGYCLNSMALRSRPSPELPFRDFLLQVQNIVLAALDASSVPFDRVVRELQPSRDPGRHPLFQILFSMQPPAPEFAPGWDLTQMDVTLGTAKYDLYLELEERLDGMAGRFLYSTDLFDAPTIRRMIGHWTNLLEAVTNDPAGALGRLRLLTSRESREMLHEWNDTARAFPRTTLHRWFEAQAHETPEAIAIEFEGCVWSYQELNRRADHLARRLQRAGVGRETLVAIAIERSAEMIAGQLAILKAGGAYLPLDASLPRARIELLMSDACPAILLTQSALLDRLSQSPAAIVLCDESIGDEDGARRAVGCSVDAENLAYVIYTSGSTGKPKAVEVSHRAVVNLLAAMQREPGFAASDSLLAVTTLSFDIAALELFLPLVSGGRVIIAGRDDAADPFRLAALVQRSRCTVMQATPAMWRGLIETGWLGSDRLKILCGGDVMSRSLATNLLGRGASVWNMYGPTETTIWSLSHKVELGSGPVPIGRPLSNTRIYILDAGGTPVPVGVPGELHIDGAGLARGYRGDETLSEAKFVTRPAVTSEPLYRTGDAARYRPDGLVEYLGRMDHQVKIRGFRVGLEEVEATLAAHPGIASAAARTWIDASGEASLAAYLTGLAELVPGSSELRQFMRQRLPDYMVPSYFVTMSALPMTSSGKVDRNRLPEPQRSVRSPESPQPRDEIERRLVALWKDLLGTSQVGIHDNFFDLGGHSLLAFMLVAEITKMTGRELPLATLFRAPTIAALAELLRAAEEPHFSYLVPVRPEGSGAPLFIVHGILGNVLQLKPLAERVRTDRPIYALQARGVDPRQEPHAGIAEMAEAYIDAICAVQPTGPYALGGYSFGGLVAYEMACRLRERGQDVEILALLDVDVHERNLPLGAWLAHQWRTLIRVISTMNTLPPRQRPIYVVDKTWHRLLLRLGVRDHGDPSTESTGPLPSRYRRMYQIGMREFIAFTPRRYEGRVSFFCAAERGSESCDPLPVWRRVANAIDVFVVAGRHLTMIDEPRVEILARELSRCVDRVDAARRRPFPHAGPDGTFSGERPDPVTRDVFAEGVVSRPLQPG